MALCSWRGEDEECPTTAARCWDLSPAAPQGTAVIGAQSGSRPMKDISTSGPEWRGTGTTRSLSSTYQQYELEQQLYKPFVPGLKIRREEIS